MAIVTKSIGTTARDFSTITLWEADLDNGAVYAAGDDAVGEGFNDSVFDEVVTINGGTTIGLNSRKLSVAAGERHDGTAGTGTRIVRTGSGDVLVFSGTISTTMEWWEVDGNGNDSDSMVKFTSDGVTNSIANNLCHDTIGNGAAYAGIISSGAATAFINNIVYNIAGFHTASRPAFGIRDADGSAAADNQILNNTVHNVSNDDGGGIVEIFSFNTDNATRDCRNNIATDPSGTSSGTKVCFDTWVNVVNDHNLSSDATAAGTGSLTNKTSANQFISTVGGSEDLHLKSGADAIDGGADLGTTPAGIEVDINDFDRNADPRRDPWDMGAHESSFVTETIGTAARDFSTITLWEADLVNKNAADDIIGEMFDDSAFDEAVLVNDVTSASLKLTVASTERHDGTAGTGARIVRTGGGIIVDWSAAVPHTVEWLEIDGNGNSGIALGFRDDADIAGTVSKMIVHDIENTVSVAGFRSSANPGDNSNVIIYDVLCTGAGAETAVGVAGTSSAGKDTDFYNMTIHDITDDNGTGASTCITMNDQANKDYRNIIATQPDGTSSGTKACYGDSAPASAVVDHNLASDTTASGTGSLDSKSAANQFVSTTLGSEDLHLKSGADAIRAGVDLGTSPPGVEFDIDDRDRDAQGDVWSMGADQFVPTTITETIGTAARDFSTITLWEAALSTKSDDMIGEMFNDSVFDETVTIDDATPNSLRLTVAATERHDGTAGTGARIVRSSNHSFNMNSDNLTVEWIEIDVGGEVTIGVTLSGDNQFLTKGIIHNIISAFGTIGISLETSTETQSVLNCIVYAVTQTAADSTPANGIFSNNNVGTKNILNNTVHNIVCNNGTGQARCFAIIDRVNHSYQNNIATDPSGSSSGSKLCYNNESPGSAVIDHNLASDTTASGTGSLDSKASANQFISTTLGSEDLHLKSSADAKNAGLDLGTTPIGVEFDIDDRDRDAEGDVWDMGAHEFVGSSARRIMVVST